MAFLCPSGLGRKRHTRGYASMIGRVPERQSYDFMAKLELANLNKDQETLRIVLHAFSARENEELSVKQGQKVHELFREGDWAYVVADDKKMGFIPFTHCAKLGTGTNESQKQTQPHIVDTVKSESSAEHNNFVVQNGERKSSTGSKSQTGSEHLEDSFLSSDWSYDSESDVSMGIKSSVMESGDSVLMKNSFNKLSYTIGNKLAKNKSNQSGDLNSLHRRQSDLTNASDADDVFSNDVRMVLYNYESCTEDEVSVRKGDIVLVLDSSQNDWFLVETLDREQGHIPSYYLGELTDDALDELDHAVVPMRTPQNDSDTTSNETKHSHIPPRRYPSYENTKSVHRPSDILNFPVQKSHSIGGVQANLPPKGDTSDKNNRLQSLHKRTLFKMTSESNLVSPRSRLGLSKRSNNSGQYPPYGRRRSQVSETQQSPRSAVRQQSITDSFRSNAAYDALDDLDLEDDLDEFVTTIDSVFRPQSTPPYQTYKYEKERQAYYDEYFFDEPNPALKPNPDDEVINVSEIMKLRKAEQRSQSRSSSKKKSSGRSSKHRASGRDLLSIRQIMNTLPSTKIENNIAANLVRTTSPDKNISSDETDDTLSRKPTHASLGDKSEIVEQSDKGRHNRFDQNKEVKNLDWSFGYPRKTKSSEPKENNTKHYNGHSTSSVGSRRSDDDDDDVDDSDDMYEDYSEMYEDHSELSDDEKIYVDEVSMMELLKSTDDALESSEKLLSERQKRPDNTGYNSNKDHKIVKSEPNVQNKRQPVVQSKSLNNKTCGKENEYHHHNHRKSQSTRHRHEHGQVCKTLSSEISAKHVTSRHEEKMQANSNQKVFHGENVTLQTKKSDEIERQGEISRRLDLLLQNKSTDIANDIRCPNKSAKVEQNAQELNEAIEKCSNYIQNYVIDNDLLLGMAKGGVATHSDNRNKETSDSENNHKADNQTEHNVQIGTSAGENRVHNDTDNVDNQTEELPKIDFTDVHGITEFVVMYDYKSDTETGMSVKRGEILHIGLDGQENKHWYWAYSPTRHRYGYVPRVYVTIAMVTIL